MIWPINSKAIKTNKHVFKNGTVSFFPKWFHINTYKIIIWHSLSLYLGLQRVKKHYMLDRNIFARLCRVGRVQLSKDLGRDSFTLASKLQTVKSALAEDPSARSSTGVDDQPCDNKSLFAECRLLFLWITSIYYEDNCYLILRVIYIYLLRGLFYEYLNKVQ